MRLVILGSAGSYPGPRAHCSSYLLVEETFNLVLDMGNGSLTNLYEHISPDQVDAVFLSHEHIDHLADFIGFYHLCKYGLTRDRRIKLLAVKSVVDRVVGLLGDPEFDGLVEVIVIPDDGGQLVIGPFDATFRQVSHPVVCLGVRIQTSKASFAYSADSGPCEALHALAKGVDLFLCEATWSSSDSDRVPDLHLSSSQAGEIATSAGAKALVLTHIAYPNDPVESVVEAQRAAPLVEVSHAIEGTEFVF